MVKPAKVAVITGAGSGIGRHVSLTLAGEGYRVVLAGRRAETLEAVAVEAPPDATLVAPTDVADPAAVEALFAGARDTFGRVDVLFNNAGIFGTGGPFEDVAYEQWRTVVDTNLTGAFLCAQAAYRVMKDQTPQGGRIINNGSISAHVPRPQAVAYAATKHAITGLTKTIALEGRRHNVACGQIDIGNAATDMTTKMQRGVPQADGSVAVEPRMDVAHAANAVVHMASLPLDANVLFMTVMATAMPYVGRG
jgi:NAD(P)-dependent dehydrogenase (short-subunit alcohol dehydrogenase family)